MQMWRVYFRNHPTLGHWVLRAERHPGWIWKTALVSMVITIVIPLALLAVAALAIGFIVFVLLGAMATVTSLLQRLLGITRQAPSPLNQPRVNVRVIQEDHL